MSLPTVVLEGRTTADAELHWTPAGKPVCNMRIACSDSRKDEHGNWETTEQIFVNVPVWNDAERVAELAVKGARVTVAGRLFQREYQRQDGAKGVSLEVKHAMVHVRPQQSQQGYGGQSQGYQQPASDPWAVPTTGQEPPF